MPYKIVGIDVHKRMLHVVVSDVEVDGEYEFTRRVFGSHPEALRSLATWLVEQEAEEVVMESTAQYWRPVWETLERYWKPDCPKRQGANSTSGTLHLAQAQSNRSARAQEGLPRCRTFGEAAGRQRTGPELCARCRAASVADSHAHQAQPSAAAEPIGGFAGRSAHQNIQPSLGFAGSQRTAHGLRRESLRSHRSTDLTNTQATLRSC